MNELLTKGGIPHATDYGLPGGFPNTEDFVSKYLPSRFDDNWHHTLFYRILNNMVVQDPVTGLLFPNARYNTYKDESGKSFRKWIPDKDVVNKSVLIFAPRGHAKSTCVTINYPLWELYRDPNQRILIVSANQDIATGFVRGIMWQLENNQKLQDELGDLTPETKRKWGEKAFIVRRTTKEKDPSIAGIGVGGKLISRRADIIIIDDLLDLETSRTAAQRKKTREWYENVLLPILEDGGRLIIVGTAWYKNDLLDDLFKNGSFSLKVKLKALLYNSKYHLAKNSTKTSSLPYDLNSYPQAMDVAQIFSTELMKSLASKVEGSLYEHGVLWHPVWSFEKLMSKKDEFGMSDSSFARQYLNEPMSETDKVFKDPYIKAALAKGTKKGLVNSYDNLNPPSHLGYGRIIAATGVDLAISKKDTADDNALATWGLTENRMYVPLWLEAGKMSPDTVKMKVLDQHVNFSPVKIKVENVAYQDMMRQELANDDIPVEGFSTTSSRKFNEETGLARFAMLFEQGRIILPAAQDDPEKYKMIQRLINELNDYTYDSHLGDLLAASWFAVDSLYQFDKKMVSNRGFFSDIAVVEQMKHVVAPNRILIISTKPPYYKYSYTSLVQIFEPLSEGSVFFEEGDKFFILATKEAKCVAYIFDKTTRNVIGKVEGDTSALMFSTLLEKVGKFFNNAQIVVDRMGEGEAVFMELSRNNYPNLLCMQPDERGMPILKDGIRIGESILPIAVDDFRVRVGKTELLVKDESIVKEMAEVLGTDKSVVRTAAGEAQRIKTLAVANWLLHNYEISEKLYNQSKGHKKRSKELSVPYRVFKK